MAESEYYSIVNSINELENIYKRLNSQMKILELSKIGLRNNNETFIK